EQRFCARHCFGARRSGRCRGRRLRGCATKRRTDQHQREDNTESARNEGSHGRSSKGVERGHWNTSGSSSSGRAPPFGAVRFEPGAFVFGFTEVAGGATAGPVCVGVGPTSTLADGLGGLTTALEGGAAPTTVGAAVAVAGGALTFALGRALAAWPLSP